MAAITVRRSPSRALTVREPFFSPMSLLDEIESFARDIWETRMPEVYSTHMYPRLDMYEEKDELVMKVELPGIQKENIDVSLENGCLTIQAEKKQEEVSQEASYYSCERCFGTFSRSVSMPFPVDGNKISATFENGLLEIRLPKAEEAKAKHIEVKVK